MDADIKEIGVDTREIRTYIEELTTDTIEIAIYIKELFAHIKVIHTCMKVFVYFLLRE
jgi:hypothetical protein